MEDETKPVAKKWEEAARKTQENWGKEPGQKRHSPENSGDATMERTKEGYGSSKEDTDPAADKHGRTSSRPSD